MARGKQNSPNSNITALEASSHLLNLGLEDESVSMSIVSGTHKTTRTRTRSAKLAPNKFGKRKGYLNVAVENGHLEA